MDVPLLARYEPLSFLYVEGGLRFMYDFNSVSDAVEDKPSAWNIQLSMTYLL